MTRAATVVLLRDTERGPQVLLLRRSARARTFPGAWVFPGGAVEAEDGPQQDEFTAHRAAARETAEEAGIVVSPTDLVPWSRWRPPAEAPMRRETVYLVGAAPDQTVVTDGVEIVDALWITPVDALERHATGDLELMPPTWLTLHDLAPATSVAAVLATAPAEPEVYASTLRNLGGRTTLSWGGHRPDLDITERPWRLVPAGRRRQ
ncbi:NUDIX hydrolase [Streptomyces mirabilis]|uniref:NUDIX hydrolase n=1 Tax=Streptomyces mirabilis TaxID=68239 RepID=UPI00339E77C7